MRQIERLAGLGAGYDLVVVGAGPAGMAAAATAAAHGLSVLVADEAAGPGGQVYRAITTTPTARREVLGRDYWQGAALAAAFAASAADYIPGCAAWYLDETLQVGLSAGGTSRTIAARRVILATGALERPFPIKGWTLPGVMMAGAAQILLKSAGLVAAGQGGTGGLRAADLAARRAIPGGGGEAGADPRDDATRPMARRGAAPARFSPLPLCAEGRRPDGRGTLRGEGDLGCCGARRGRQGVA